MSISAALTTGLKATRMQSDIEFQLQGLMQRKIALLNKAANLSNLHFNSLFTSDPNDDIYYQQQLIIIQSIEKELDTRKEMLETKRKIYMNIAESTLKNSKENAKKGFTING